MCFKKQIIVKEGVLYEDFKIQLRPFDVILFKGGALFSNIVSLLEEHGNSVPKSGEFTHVGVVVTYDILEHKNMMKGKLYILESIVGGSFGHGVKNIEGNTNSGVQIRLLDDVITACDEPNESIIACGQLIRNPLDYYTLSAINARFTAFYNAYVGKKYDANPYSMLSAIFKWLRPCRDNIEELFNTTEWYFCSELIALLFQYMEIYPQSINAKNVLPRDIANPDADNDTIPKIINNITYITTPLHYKGYYNL